MMNQVSSENVECQSVSCQNGMNIGYQTVVALDSYIIASIILKLMVKKSFSFKYHFFLIFVLLILFSLFSFLSPSWHPQPVNLLSIVSAFSVALVAYKTMLPQKLYAFLKKL